MKKIFALIFVVLCFMFYVSSVSANYGQYGEPSPSYAIIVDKMVQKPGTADYIDNLSVSDPRFKPDQIVFFKVKIKNTSTIKLVGMEVKDTVPSYLEPVEGPGTLSSETSTITWNAGDFNVDEEKVFYLKMKVLPQANLPADKGLLCVTNFVKANSANAYDDDTSQFCIEKQVVGAAKVPSAGPELGILLLSGQVALLGAGLYFRKKA